MSTENAVNVSVEEQGEEPAVETTGEATPDAHDAFADTRDKAVEAARAAKKAAEGDAKSDDDKKTEPAKAEEAKKADEGDADLKGIAKVLRDREEKASAKLEIQQAKDEISRMRAELAAEREAIARERANVDAWRDQARKSPVDFAREVLRHGGMSPDDFVVALAKDGTPEGQMFLQQQTLQRELAELRKWKTDFESGQKSRAEQEQEQIRAAQRAETERAFVAAAVTDKYPALTKAFKGREHLLVSEAHRIGALYHEKTGQWATHDEIAEYIDSEWRSALGMIDSSQPVEASGVNGKAPQARAAGSRTVTTAAASERRTIPGKSSLKDASDDERREAAIVAAREARKHAERERS